MTSNLLEGERELKSYKIGVKTDNEVVITNKRVILRTRNKLSFGEDIKTIPIRSIVFVQHVKRKKLLGDVYLYMVGGYVEEIHVLDSQTSYEIYTILTKLVL